MLQRDNFIQVIIQSKNNYLRSCYTYSQNSNVSYPILVDQRQRAILPPFTIVVTHTHFKVFKYFPNTPAFPSV
jgi:hypothetical protein